MKTHKIPTRARFQIEAWMDIANPNLTVEEAVEKLIALGNPILSIDAPNRRIKVLQEDSSTCDIWQCEYCPAYSTDLNAIIEHENTHDEVLHASS